MIVAIVESKETGKIKSRIIHKGNKIITLNCYGHVTIHNSDFDEVTQCELILEKNRQNHN